MKQIEIDFLEYLKEGGELTDKEAKEMLKAVPECDMYAILKANKEQDNEQD